MYSAVDMFLAVHRSLLFVREEPPNSNAGQAVEAFQRGSGGKKGDSWCMDLQHHVGYSAFGSHWPLPRNGSCQETYDFAARHGITVLPEGLQPGDLLVFWHEKDQRFGHVAAIQAVKGSHGFPTVEGNTNTNGSSNGWGTFEKYRTPGPNDRGIRWSTYL